MPLKTTGQALFRCLVPEGKRIDGMAHQQKASTICGALQLADFFALLEDILPQLGCLRCGRSV